MRHGAAGPATDKGPANTLKGRASTCLKHQTKKTIPMASLRKALNLSEIKKDPMLAEWLGKLDRGRRPRALLTGFDGTHTARLATEDEIGKPDLIVNMEMDSRERAIVAKKIGYSLDAKLWHLTEDNVLVISLTDVWHLVSDSATILEEMLVFMKEAAAAVDKRALIIAMWGSPCQDLTSYAQDTGGCLGFVGNRSVHMHVAPYAHWLIQNISPDIEQIPPLRKRWFHERRVQEVHHRSFPARNTVCQITGRT